MSTTTAPHPDVAILAAEREIARLFQATERIYREHGDAPDADARADECSRPIHAIEQRLAEREPRTLAGVAALLRVFLAGCSPGSIPNEYHHDAVRRAHDALVRLAPEAAAPAGFPPLWPDN